SKYSVSWGRYSVSWDSAISQRLSRSDLLSDSVNSLSDHSRELNLSMQTTPEPGSLSARLFGTSKSGGRVGTIDAQTTLRADAPPPPPRQKQRHQATAQRTRARKRTRQEIKSSSHDSEDGDEDAAVDADVNSSSSSSSSSW